MSLANESSSPLIIMLYLLLSAQKIQLIGSKLKKLTISVSCSEEVTMAEHFGYYFSFIGYMFGPAIFFHDHKRFMYGEVKARSNTQGVSIQMYIIYLNLTR